MINDDSQPFTKADGRRMLAELRDELHRCEGRLLERFAFLEERLRIDVFDLLEIRSDQLDLRVTRLEQHTGMAGR